MPKLIYIEDWERGSYAMLYTLRSDFGCTDKEFNDILNRVHIKDQFSKIKYKIINTREDCYKLTYAIKALCTFIYQTEKGYYFLKYYKVPDLNILNLVENKKLTIIRYYKDSKYEDNFNKVETEKSYFLDLLHIRDIEVKPIYSSDIETLNSVTSLMKEDNSNMTILELHLKEFYDSYKVLSDILEKYPKKLQIYFFDKPNKYYLFTGKQGDNMSLNLVK